MKDKKTIMNEIWTKFLTAHPEINFQNLDPLGQMMSNQQKIYSHTAINFAVDLMIEEMLLDKK